MKKITGELIGGIHVTVYKTPDGKRFFYLQADNKDVLPIVDILEDTLYWY